MVTSNHQQQKYKNNGIVNGSRGYVDSIQASKDNPNKPEIEMRIQHSMPSVVEF